MSSVVENMQVQSCDVGSLPPKWNMKTFELGAKYALMEKPAIEEFIREAIEYFKDAVIESLIDKIKAGIEIPVYPQFRDMNEMFLNAISGIEKIEGRYYETETLSVKDGRIPEVSTIFEREKEVYELLGEKLKLKVCITGPHTLSFLFAYRDSEIFSRLADMLLRFVEDNVLKSKYCEVHMVALDEPTFGTVDDPLVDVGSEGRENLLMAWERIFERVRGLGAETAIHLHSTSDPLFWEVKNLEIVESHVEDQIYKSKHAKERLKETGKVLRASICLTDYDILIKRSLPKELKNSQVAEKIGEIWSKIRRGQLNPESFLESVDLIRKRLKTIIEFFGGDLVPYAGPECGLRGFPTYDCAIECLRRISSAVKSIC